MIICAAVCVIITERFASSELSVSSCLPAKSLLISSARLARSIFARDKILGPSHISSNIQTTPCQLPAKKLRSAPFTPVAFATGFLVSVVASVLASVVKGFASTLNGPSSVMIAVKGPLKSLGSRHESEQVPPHPYSKLKVLS